MTQMLKHRASCALYDPCPSSCDCGFVSQDYQTIHYLREAIEKVNTETQHLRTENAALKAELAEANKQADYFASQAFRVEAELAALKAQEPVAWMVGGVPYKTLKDAMNEIAVYVLSGVTYIASPLFTTQQPAAVPAGWKLVPVDPTKEMLDAYVEQLGRFQSARTDWAAMLAAAPEAPQAQDKDSKCTQA